MLRVDEIMTADPVTVSPETTIREPMELLGNRHLSGAPVVSGGELIGVVSATDLMTFAAAVPGVPTERDDGWSEIPEPPLDAEVEQEAEPASAFFSDLWDDSGVDVNGRISNVDTPEWNALEEHDVSEVMTRAPLITIAPSAHVEMAAELMRQHRIHRLLVTDGRRLLGVISTSDVSRAVADHRFHTHEYVFGHARVVWPMAGPKS